METVQQYHWRGVSLSRHTRGKCTCMSCSLISSYSSLLSPPLSHSSLFLPLRSALNLFVPYPLNTEEHVHTLYVTRTSLWFTLTHCSSLSFLPLFPPSSSSLPLFPPSSSSLPLFPPSLLPSSFSHPYPLLLSLAIPVLSYPTWSAPWYSGLH